MHIITENDAEWSIYASRAPELPAGLVLGISHEAQDKEINVQVRNERGESASKHYASRAKR